ncbi:hypothetical protein SmJEL517_g05424 [Synchytrium microbalum]|uniref:DUF962 domain-containing protein n=1 Tax=Synchytrium microbalum TaxID=1806994 RepID=A0A507BWC3_9FUNG|nr:uncharacterized protein SmJEL517_g05424 [Synchytrium microbalum]TPX31199.1 hypothetical protein SmJEL517_g05424 [Synchytrium microbalum]
MPADGFKTFDDFYPFYLGEHSLAVTRRFHVIGTTTMMGIIAYAVTSQKPRLLPLAILQAYTWSWFSHFVFEGNKPATWTYPIWSAMGDFKMFYEVISGQRSV